MGWIKPNWTWVGMRWVEGLDLSWDKMGSIELNWIKLDWIKLDWNELNEIDVKCWSQTAVASNSTRLGLVLLSIITGKPECWDIAEDAEKDKSTSF